MAMTVIRRLLILIAAGFIALPAAAQDGEVPYWASIRVTELNMRVGPSEEYRIRWVYHRPGLPLKVLRLKEGWRLVEDHEGGRGWVMARFLTRSRGAVVIGKGLTELRESSEDDARVLWRLQPGVVGALGDCDDGWCQLSVGPRMGYARQDRIWGAGNP
jgi:SH3-like domain-containing protein